MTNKIQTIIDNTQKQLFNAFGVDNIKNTMKALKKLLNTKSDDWIVDELLPRHIKGGTRTIIRRSDINGKHIWTKVKYVGYCHPTLVSNFCINYKKRGGMFKADIEDSFIL